MVNDKELFSIMIKYHPIFVGWLIQKGLVEKGEDALLLIENKTNKEESIWGKPIITPIKIYDDGVQRINYDSGHPEDAFIRLSLTKGDDYTEITSSGIDIFDIGFPNERCCHISQFTELFRRFPDKIFDAYIPKNFPRFKDDERVAYIRMLERQIEFIKNNNYKYIGYYSFNRSILGHFSGDSIISISKTENVKRYGIFANTDIYKRINWDWELVEKYKDQLNWRELINHSNLIWDEENIIEYEKYIPFCVANADTYCDKFQDDIDYTKFGYLSNDFLDKHKDTLDWLQLFKKGKLNWTGEELDYFCHYAMSINLPYSKSFRTTSAAEQIGWSIVGMIDNPNVSWNTDNLMAYLSVNNHCWEEFVKKHRPELFKIFLSIPNIKKIAEPHANEINCFWEIIHNPHDFPYDELTPEFTIENIQIHKEDWSQQIREKFFRMQRTPDTNYSSYSIETQWDIFINRINIPLTYEMAKYLKGLDIKIGGGYTESDGGYIESDHRFPIVNALQEFSHHHIESFKDILLCMEDEDIADVLLKNHNLDLLKTITDMFFKDYTIKQYIEVINKLKNWNEIDEFYYGEIGGEGC